MPMRYLCLLLLLWPVALLRGHEIGVRQIKEGLPHGIVFCLAQDTHGFMWIGTDDGLVRFDGHRFQPWVSEWDSGSAAITGLCALAGGGVAAGYYREGLVRIPPPGGGPLLSQASAFGHDLVSHRGQLFFARSNTIFRVDSAGEYNLHIWDKLRQLGYNWDSQQANLSINLYAHAEQDRLLFGCEVGLFEVVGEQIRPYARGLLDGQAVYALTADAEGTLWVGGQGTLLGIRGERIIHRYEREFPAAYRLHRLQADRRGHLWISVLGHGLFRLDTHWQQVRYLSPELGIGETNINYILEDRAGSIWIATYGEGILVLYPSLFRQYGAPEGLANGYVTDLARVPRQLFIGQSTGLSVLPEPYERVEEVFSRSETYVFDLRPGPGGHIWLSYNPPSDGRLPFDARRWPQVEPYPAFWIEPLPGGQRLVAAARVNPLQYIRQPGEPPLALPLVPRHGLDRIKVMAHFADGEVWLGRQSGLFRIAKPGGGIPDLASDSLMLLSDLPHEVNDLLVQGDSVLWVASGRGLHRWNRRGWEHLGLADGLPHQVCTRLVIDGQGRLWGGTPRGLFCLQAGRVITLGRPQGLESEAITALLVDPEAQWLWVGTSHGLFSMDLAEFEAYEWPPAQVFVTTLASPEGEIPFPQEVTLPQETQGIKIHFSAFQYAHPQDVQYAFKLAGGSWQTTQQPEVYLSGLAGGSHTFLVKARLAHQSWTPPARLRLHLTPPFTQTPTFYALLALLGIGLVALAWRLHLQQVHRQEAQKRQWLQRINELEQQALSAMMNPHFIFNALNSIQHFLHTQSPEQANIYLVQFARLIRLSMEAMRQQHSTLDQEIERLRLYLELEQLRFGDQLTYHITCAPEVDPEAVELPPMLIQPFVENAIWHGILPAGRPGAVSIQIIGLPQDGVCIQISDDGVGLDHDEAVPGDDAHVSRGISLSRDRLRHFHPQARLDIGPRYQDDGQACGTVVTITLPG